MTERFELRKRKRQKRQTDRHGHQIKKIFALLPQWIGYYEFWLICIQLLVSTWHGGFHNVHPDLQALLCSQHRILPLVGDVETPPLGFSA